MLLSSDKNLQIGSLAGFSRHHVFFRAFLAPEGGRTVKKPTLIIEARDGTSTLLREIPEECTSIRVMSDGSLWCLGRFGNLYIYKENTWSDLGHQPRREDIAYLTRLYEDEDGSVIAIGAEATILRSGTAGWTRLLPHGFEPKEHLFGLCRNPGGGYYAVGLNGLLIDVGGVRSAVLDRPSDSNLLAAWVNDAGELAVCGSSGAFFFGRPPKLQNLTRPELEADFTDMIVWRDELLLSANSSILCFKSGALEEWKRVPSMSLFSTNDALWTLGVRSLNLFDGKSWSPFVVELDV